MSPGFVLATLLAFAAMIASIVHAIRAGPTTLLVLACAAGLLLVLAGVFYDAGSFIEADMPSPTAIALGGIVWSVPGALIGELRRRRRS